MTDEELNDRLKDARGQSLDMDVMRLEYGALLLDNEELQANLHKITWELHAMEKKNYTIEQELHKCQFARVVISLIAGALLMVILL